MPERLRKMLSLNLCLLLAGLFVCIILLCLVPPISRDALTHHLAIPKLYLQQGAIYEIPSLDFSYYPMNLDLLYMIPLAFGNDIIPKYIHFIFALLTAWLIYGYLREKLNRTYGLLGSLFFLSIPIIVKLSITVYVDLGLIFFTTASLLFLFRWIEQEYQTRYLLASALFCGLIVGTKYNGLICLFLLSSFAPLMYSRSAKAKANNLTAVKYGSIFLITALAVAAPWLVRNYIWTGNPLYPLFKNIFNPATQQAATGGMDIFTLRRLFFNETSLQILLLPLRIFFEGQDNNPQYFDGKLNPFLLFLPFFAFIKQTDAPIVKLEKKAMLAFCILFFLFALFQSGMRIRYISPMIPFLVILSMFGVHNIITFAQHHALSRIKISGYLLSVLLVTAMLLYNGKYLLEQFRYVQPFDYISGKINRDEYITRYRPEYPVVQYANKQLQAGSKTLCLFLGNRGYYMDFPHIFDVPTNSNSPFSQLIATSSDATAIQKTLLKDEYHHILLRNDLTTSWINHLGEHREIAVFFFQHNLELMYSTKDYSLLRINSLPNNHREIIQ